MKRIDKSMAAALAAFLALVPPLVAAQDATDDAANADAMGQFGRLTSVEDLPSDKELDALIREGAKLARTAPTPRKVKHEPKPAPGLHPEFAAALKANPKAKASLDAAISELLANFGAHTRNEIRSILNAAGRP